MKLFSVTLIALPVLLLIAGLAGLLRSEPVAPPGVRDARLAPILVDRQNSVSSQTLSDPHRIEPIRLNGEPVAAFARLRQIVARTPGVHIVEQNDGYLYAHCESRVLRFVDDLELLLDAAAGVVQVRSASRLGSKDFGVNRARIEALRTTFNSQPGAS
jgi:uncharacterized protein (DUF1499 family)